MVNTAAEPSNSRYSQVTLSSVMWGSADSVSRPVVCRWREHTVSLGGAVGLKPELSSLEDPLPLRGEKSQPLSHFLLSLQQSTATC